MLSVMRSIVSMWIKDGDEAINHLNSWLSVNSKDMEKMKALDDVLVKIGGDATKGVGVKIGDMIESYSGIWCKYGESIANSFLDAILRNPYALEEILIKIKGFDFGKEPHKVTLQPREVISPYEKTIR